MTVPERVEWLLDQAEKEGRCAFAENARDGARLRYLWKKGRLVRPLAGLYLRTAAWDRLDGPERHRHIVRGLARKHPSWVFCDVSAALMYGLEVPEAELGTVHVAVDPGRLPHRIQGLIRHEVVLSRVRIRNGVALLEMGDLLFGCLRRLSFGDSLALADSALRRFGLTREWLEGLFKRGHKGCRGIRKARLVARLSDARAENGGESKVRARLFELERVTPELQVWIGRFRVDYLFKRSDGSEVVGELDGRDKYLDPRMTGGKTVEEVLAEQARRDQFLEAQGLAVMHFTFEQAMDLLRFPALLREFGIPMRELGDPDVDLIMRPTLPCMPHPRVPRFRLVECYEAVGLSAVVLEAA